MKAQATKAMAKPFDTNLVTKLWVTITNNSFLCLCLSEYIKLAKIAIVYVFGLLEDELIFSTFAIIKDKLCSQLGPHLEMTICMFGQEFFTKNNFSYRDDITS
jgi:hypothetical protein